MKTSVSLAMTGGLLFLALSQPVLARGGAGGGGASHGSPTGPGAGSAAATNANGRFASDRDKGLDRAQDRMNAQGLSHQKATTAPGTPQRQTGAERKPVSPSR